MAGKQGFASIDKARQREIAKLGGQMAHRKGTAHVFTAAEASAAGRKGVEVKRAKRLAAQQAAA